jgi:hypothetical protein
MRPHVWLLYACVRLLSTARDVQLEAKAKGTPWMISKSYDCFAPVSTFIPKSEVPDCHNLDLYVSRDTDCAQQPACTLWACVRLSCSLPACCVRSKDQVISDADTTTLCHLRACVRVCVCACVRVCACANDGGQMDDDQRRDDPEG